MGFRIQILAGLALSAVWQSANAAMKALNETGTTREVMSRYGPVPEGATMNDILGVPAIYELEERYGRYDAKPVAAR